MRKLLIVTKAQYGYHIDPYKFGYYLKSDFEIKHMCWDFGLPKISVPGIQTKYIARAGNKTKRFLQFLKQINEEIKTGAYDLVFLVYFPGCSFLRWQNPQQTFNLDIRTATDTDNSLINLSKDHLLKWESSRFPYLSILSHGLARKLGFKKYHFLPLGGEQFCKTNKSFEVANLLYVGTLENRNLIVFVRGLHAFLRTSNHLNLSVTFTIIGDGPGNERAEIETYVQANGLEKVINTTGYVHNDRLFDYFENANVGISFVPITPYYTHQPPTKTYEYLLSGLPVLATATEENRKIVNEACGVLIQDTEESVVGGLNQLVNQFKYFDSKIIRQVCSKNSWRNIAQNNLLPYLESLKLAEKTPFPVG